MKRLIGLRVVAVKAFVEKQDKRYKNRSELVEPRFILFSDKKTYIELEEQDYYDYHDCSTSARYINIRQNKEVWRQMMEDKEHFIDSTQTWD